MEVAMKCDFCSSADPRWRFEAAPFALDFGPVLATSDAGWAACDACCQLIVKGDRVGLTDRAVRQGPASAMGREELRTALEIIHGLFFRYQLNSNPSALGGGGCNGSV
jgi:hypothetical protein